MKTETVDDQNRDVCAGAETRGYVPSTPHWWTSRMGETGVTDHTVAPDFDTRAEPPVGPLHPRE